MPSRSERLAAAAAFLLSLVTVSAAPRAATLYVAPDGSDAAQGTHAAPFRTLVHAATVAEAGDTVTVAAGSYSGAMVVARSGRPDAPIRFVSNPPGTAAITGAASWQSATWAGDDDVAASTPDGWVTLSGFVFHDVPTPYLVRASRGWRIENCVFRNTGFGINIRGDDVTVAHTSFTSIEGPNAHAIVAVGAKRVRIQDVAIRSVNVTRQIADIPRSAVTKFVHTTALSVDNLHSEGNVGPGLWLDWDNVDFSIRHSLFRANLGDRHDWEGGGLWLEGNGQAHGLVADNVFIGNAGPGLAILESSGITVRGNRFIDNRNCVELRNIRREGDGDRTLGALHFASNECRSPREAAVLADNGDWAGWTAASRDVTFVGNRYGLGRSDAFNWLGRRYRTVADARNDLGFERDPASPGRLP